jgi:hypothetical protein
MHNVHQIKYTNAPILWENTCQRIYPTELFTQVQSHLYIRLNTAELFVLAKKGNNV